MATKKSDIEVIVINKAMTGDNATIDWLSKSDSQAELATKSIDHAVELLTEDYYLVKVQFAGTNSLYTYKVDNSMELKVDDFVVVKPRGRFATAQVMAVGTAADIDLTAGYEYDYVVQKISSVLYDT